MQFPSPNATRVAEAIDRYYAKWDAQNVYELTMEEIDMLEKAYENAQIVYK